MKLLHFDIDIDVADRDTVLSTLPHVRAKQTNGHVHPSGIYLQTMPFDPSSRIGSYSYDEAKAKGYIKIDLLNNRLYEPISDEALLNTLLKQVPLWELLLHKPVVDKLHHVNNSLDLLQEYAPRSVEELAIVLALIRPGKRHLRGMPYSALKEQIWTPTDKYYYKKSHAIAYALSVVLQLNTLVHSQDQASED